VDRRVILAMTLMMGLPALAAGDHDAPPAPPIVPMVSTNPPSKAGTLSPFLALVNQKAREVAATRKIRLAVIPIKGTESPRYGDKGFGAFLTEKISSSMVSTDSPIRLFERTRLDAVLKEQALSASGVFDESEARKIGELAPIDYILTGTFTRLEQTIAVNLRFIDVVSGEVRGNISENLELTPDLAALFEDIQSKPATAATTAGKPQPPNCDARWAPVKALMEDIGTSAKVDKLIAAAITIPFEPPCGDIHYEIMALFTRYKQMPTSYTRFLLQTLGRIEAPDNDDRDGEIIHYLLTPGQLDDEAWKAALRLSMLSKRFYLYQGWLLADRLRTDSSKRLTLERVGTLVNLVEQKKIGRPVPLEPRKAFIDIMGTLHRDYTDSYQKTQDVRPLMDCYQGYAQRMVKGADKDLVEVLKNMYDAAGPGKDRDRILGWWCDRINQFEPTRESADLIVELMREYFDVKKDYARKGLDKASANLALKTLASLSGKHIAEAIPFIIDSGTRLEVTGFCLENGIKNPDTVPDLNALIKGLSSEEDAEQTASIFLLKHLGPAALPAEPIVLKQLRRSQNKGDWDDQNKYLRHDLLGLLGTMQTHNPEAHAVLIHYLQDIESYVADEAVLALANIGEPAAAALKAEFPKIEEPYKQIRVIKVFRLRGKAATPHLPWLKNVFQTTKSPYVKDAAEDAMDAIAKG
jgi:hypothetical protein